MWLQSSTRKPQWFQYLKMVFFKIPNVTIQLVFQHQVTHVFVYTTDFLCLKLSIESIVNTHCSPFQHKVS